MSQRKKLLLKEIKIWQKQKNKTSQYIDVEELAHNNDIDRRDYYLDPMNMVVHMAMHVKEFAKDPSLLAPKLFVPKKRINRYIQNLERMGIIKMTSKGIEVLDVDLHIPKDSPLFDSYKSQCYTNTMNRLKQVGEDKTYNFTVIFSANEEARAEINTQFMKFLSRTKKIVDSCESDEVFQMNFDLFSWTEIE